LIHRRDLQAIVAYTTTGRLCGASKRSNGSARSPWMSDSRGGWADRGGGTGWQPLRG